MRPFFQEVDFVMAAVSLKPQLTSFSATSVTLSWSQPMTASSYMPYYGINCSSTSNFPEDMAADDSFLSRSQCTYYTVDNSTTSLTVTGLSPATSYLCCIQDHNYSPLGCVNAQTRGAMTTGAGQGGGGVSNAVAGVVGGIIATVLVLAAIFTVAGMVVGMLYYKKRQMKK